MFKKLRATAAIPALLAGCLGLATSAQAQLCPIGLIAGQQDGVCISDDQTNTVNPTRVLFQTSSEDPGQEIFTSLAGLPVLPGFTPGIYYLTGPGETDLAAVLTTSGVPSDASDALALRVTGGNIDIAFISDGATATDTGTFNTFAAGLGFIGSAQETGGWQDISAAFGVATNSIFVQSDVDTVVPEPTSLALLGTALVGLAAIRRRKQA